MTTRVFVTNDDGIDAPGIRALTAALVEHGYEPLVVAPNRDYSGAGASLLSLTAGESSFDRAQLSYEKRVLAEAPDVEAYALDGPPALCALTVMRGGFGGPTDLVVSGINHGLNVGPAVTHSGTLNAALVASRAGIQSLAVSAAFLPDAPEDLRYDTAAQVAMQVLRALPSTDHPLVNLNVPCCDLAEVKGIRSAGLADGFRYRSFIEDDGNGMLTRTYKEDPGAVVAPDSDSGLVEQGYASLSALVPIEARDCTDLVTTVVEASA